MTPNKRLGSEQISEWITSCSYVECISYLGELDADIEGALYAVIGTVGSGKSAVMAILSELFPVILTDEVARYVVEGMRDQIVAYFGDSVLSEDGKTLNRQALGDMVFSDPEKRRWLNSLVHPAVWEYVQCWAREQYAKGARICFVEVTAVDRSLGSQVDGIVIVKSNYDLIESRVQRRSGWSLDKIHSVVAIQEEQIKQYEAQAHIIYNNDGFSELRDAVRKLIHTILTTG